MNAREAVWRRHSTPISDRIAAAKSWLRDCESNHEICQPLKTQLPKRLINVGSLDGPPPRLVMSENLQEDNIRYATLSYCWGKASYCTNKGNEELHKREIPYTSLPKTLQDAISMTRYLQIPYLWIDALCIVQDDHSEWESEASRMQNIYAGSSITLAATDAASSFVGFLPLDPENHELGEYEAFLDITNSRTGAGIIVRMQHGDIRDYAANSVLHTRGWTMQEMVLSPRILHLMNKGVYWECKSQCRIETGLDFDQELQDHSRIPVRPDKIEVGENDIWYRWMQSYSRRRFSFAGDRLPALAGLLRHYQMATKDVPILGLWKGSLCQDLLWRKNSKWVQGADPTPHQLLRIPSWTWLSCPFEVAFDRHSKDEIRPEFHVELVEWAVTWTSEPLTSKIKSTRLVLNGPVREIVLSDAPDQTPCLIADKEKAEPERRPFPGRYRGVFDDGLQRSPTEYLCLLVRTRVYENKGREEVTETFIILEACTGTHSYRRVGIGHFDDVGQDGGFDLKARRTLSLI